MVGTGHLVYCEIRACIRGSQRLMRTPFKSENVYKKGIIDETREIEREERDKVVRRR